MLYTRFALAVLWLVPVARAQEAASAGTNGAKEATPKIQYLLAEGQAYNHIGAGIAGATVTLTLEETGAIIATTTTNNLGDFKLHNNEMLAGAAIVEFTKKHHKTIIKKIELGQPDGPPFVDVEMTGDVVLHGTVTDARNDAPVADANVHVEAGYKEWSANTDTNGAFTIERLFPGPAELRIDAKGYARHKITIERCEQGDNLTLKLSPERIVNLLVKNESGKPLADVGVEVVEETSADYRHQLTGTNGIATFSRLPFEATELKVRLSHEAFVSSSDFDRAIVLPADRTESTHDLVMQSAGFVVGTVRDATTREPLLGARLSVGTFLDDRLPRCWSESDGTYRVTGVPPGQAVVTIHLAGYAPELATVLVEAGKEKTLDIKLASPHTIAGVVIDTDGQPVPGAFINATKWRGHATLGLRAMTGATGAFEIIDAPADTFEVSVYAPGFKPLTDQVVTADKSRLSFTLTVDEQATASGTAPKLSIGADAPSFELTTLDGEKITTASVKGKIVLLDFWAMWCGPCVMEIPHLRKLHETFAKRQDFVMVSVSLGDDTDALRKFVTQRKMNWKHVCGDQAGAKKTSDDFGVSAIPTIFIIDKNNKIAAQDLRGSQTQQKLEELFKQGG